MNNKNYWQTDIFILIIITVPIKENHNLRNFFSRRLSGHWNNNNDKRIMPVQIDKRETKSLILQQILLEKNIYVMKISVHNLRSIFVAGFFLWKRAPAV